MAASGFALGLGCVARIATMAKTGAQFGSDSDKDRVRDATDIVELVAEHVALRPKGREFVGLCPFHDDKNPSMNVVPHKQMFHCFVCGTGGDAFSFVKRLMGLEFPEALEFLAQRAGIELTRRSRAEEDKAKGPSRGELCEANALAQKFFAALLTHPTHGQAGRDVITRRGISDAMVESFGLGVAPDRWDGLVLKAQQTRFESHVLEAAGLVKRRHEGSLYDTFRNRLMFPIHDAAGRVIAFGARKIRDEDEPKYLNSPESAVFDKSSSLFGIRQGARAIRAEKTALIVEGYTDVIACHQAGIEHAVATLGTALTSGHARILRRLCDKIVLVFDGDEAGQRAADRAVEVLFAEALDVGVVMLDRIGDAKDPDDLLKRPGGVDLLRKAIDNAQDLLAYRYDRMAASLRGAGPAAMDKALREELATLARLGLSRVPRSRRELIMLRLREITGLSDRALASALPVGRDGPALGAMPSAKEGGPPGTSPASGQMRRRPLGIEEIALGCLLVEPKLLRGVDARVRSALQADAYADPHFREIARVVHQLHEQSIDPGLEQVIDALADQDMIDRAVSLHERIRSQAEHDPARVVSQFEDCSKRILQRAPVIPSGQDVDGEAVPNTPTVDPMGRALAALSEAKRRRDRFGDDMTRLPRPPER